MLRSNFAMKIDGYQKRLDSVVNIFFDKKSTGSGVVSIQQLSKELHQPIIN